MRCASNLGAESIVLEKNCAPMNNGNAILCNRLGMDKYH